MILLYAKKIVMLFPAVYMLELQIIHVCMIVIIEIKVFVKSLQKNTQKNIRVVFADKSKKLNSMTCHRNA